MTLRRALGQETCPSCLQRHYDLVSITSGLPRLTQADFL